MACDWHVCSDARAEWDHSVLWWLKDADGLDRVRLGDLDCFRLRHKRTLECVGAAQRLSEATLWEQDPAVLWAKALAQKLLIEELLGFHHTVTGAGYGPV